MHLDEERLQRLLDGELTLHDGHATRAHLDECAGCRERVAAARREVAELERLLGLLDHPAAARSAVEAVGPRPGRHAGIRWAATIALAVGLAGVAYALPSSPVPRWIAALVERVDSEDARRAATAQQPIPEAGIAVPAGEQLLVAFDSVQVEGEVIVTLQPEATEVTIRGPRGAATFTAGSDRVSVANAGTRATYTIQVPSAAPRVEIRVAGSRRFLKDGTAVAAPAADPATGAYRISLCP